MSGQLPRKQVKNGAKTNMINVESLDQNLPTEKGGKVLLNTEKLSLLFRYILLH